MQLMWHIFHKDVRRLWPAVAVTLILLIQLTRLDCWRQDRMASSSEGWLNLLLPLTWACLIALLVHQEATAGDRHFWITWPYRGYTLLGAKLLFILVFIHLPLLVGDAIILNSHGFQPAEYVGHLVGKQLLVAAVVTLPALALATVCEKIAHFLLAAVVIFSAAAYLAGAYDPLRVPWIPVDEVRRGLSTGVLVLTASVIIPMQYFGRQTGRSRMVGIVALLISGLLYGYLPSTTTSRIRAALHPAANIPLRLKSPRPEPPPVFYATSRTGSGFVQIALPVTASGIPDGNEAQFNMQSAEIEGPGNRRYRFTSPVARRDFGNIDLDAYTFPRGQSPTWVILRLRRALMNDIQEGRVRLRVEFEVNLHHAGETAWMPLGTVQTVAGVGRCSSTIVEGPTFFQESMLKVLCESPRSISPMTGVRLWLPDSGRDWNQHLGDSAPYLSGPRETWLSPVNRLQTFFHLVSDGRTETVGNRWLVPAEAMANGKLAITSDVSTGWATADFEVRDILLRDYELDEAARPAAPR